MAWGFYGRGSELDELEGILRRQRWFTPGHGVALITRHPGEGLATRRARKFVVVVESAKDRASCETLGHVVGWLGPLRALPRPEARDPTDPLMLGVHLLGPMTEDEGCGRIPPMLHKTATAWALCGLLACAAAPASAEGPAEDVAHDAALLVYEEGRGLFLAGRHAEALVRFEAAYRAVQNDPLRYYLGRSYAELGRCAEALPLLVAVTGKLGASSSGEGEGRRARDEATCRLSLAGEHLAAWRCRDAAAQLSELVAKDLSGRKLQARAARLTEAAATCVADFDTSDAAGRTAAARQAEARAALSGKRHEEALTLARASAAARPSVPARVVSGLALARLGRCKDAVDVLEAVAPRAAVDDRAGVEAELTTCRLTLVREHVEAARCAEAMPLLEALNGSVTGADERWRATKEAWCRPRSTAFLTDTAMRKAAYKLFVAGQAAAEAKKPARAVKLYGQALGFSDEPVVRRHLAAAHFALGECGAVFEALRGVAEARRTASDRARMAGCGPYRPAARLKPSALQRRVLAIERLLSERERGRAGAALQLANALGPVSNPKLAALVIDLHFEAGDCGTWLVLVAAASPAERVRLADVGPRTASCRAREAADKEASQPEPAVATPPSRHGTASTDPSLAPLMDAGEVSSGAASSNAAVIAGWVTVASGAALLATGGVFWGLSAGATGDADRAAATWNDPTALAEVRATAWSDRERLSADADQHGLTAWVVGGVGAAAIVTGVVLLATAPGDEEPVVQPTVGLSSVGLRGRF